MSDPHPRVHRVNQAWREFFCFGIAAVMYVAGLLFLGGAFVDPAVDSSRRLGGLLLAVGTFGVAAGLRSRYVRTHPLRSDKVLGRYLWHQVTCALVVLPLGIAGLVLAVLTAPWIGLESDAGVFASGLLLAVTMLPLAWFSGVELLRHARRLRRLASQQGERRQLILVVEDQRPSVFVRGADGPVGIPLIPRQDLSQLTSNDGSVEVVGTLRHGGTVLLRTRIGEPVWSSGPAHTRRTLRSIL